MNLYFLLLVVRVKSDLASLRNNIHINKYVCIMYSVHCIVCTFVHIVEVEVCNVQMVCWHSRVLAWRTVSTLVHSVQMIESEIIILRCACTGMCAMHIVHKLVCSLCAVFVEE